MNVRLVIRFVLFFCWLQFSAEASDYRLETIVETGGVISGIDNLVSINDNARIGFVATENSDSKLFIADDPNVRQVISFFGSGRVFRGAAVNNETVPRVASRDLITGIYLERKWVADGTQSQTVVGRSPTYFNSGLSFVDINDSGVVAFVGLTNASSNTSLFAATAEPPVLLATYTGIISLRPQISNDNKVVVRDNLGRIVLWSYPSATVEVIADTTYSSTGIMPGISPDGSAVAFLGNRGSGPGLFVSIPDSGGVRQVFRLAGEGIGLFTAFDGNLRSGIASSGSYATGQYMRVVFAGTYNGVAGVYSVDAYFKANQPPIIQFPRRVVQIGEVVGTKTIQSVSLYDPVNKFGTVGFWVSYTDSSQAVLRGWPVPDTDQFTDPWGGILLGFGTDFIADAGCVLTSCVDVINYAGQPYQITPATPDQLNDWLKMKRRLYSYRLGSAKTLRLLCAYDPECAPLLAWWRQPTR